MFENSPEPDRPKRRARDFAAKVRPHHVAALAVIAALGLGLAAARTVVLPQPQPVRDGDRIRIQVVSPVEPEITPGSVMDVGDLVDGFEYRRLAPVRVGSAAWAQGDGNFDAPERRPEPRPARPRPSPGYGEEYARPPRPDAPAERRRDSRADRWFGFDAPGRDYRAEREARRARIEARMERERDGREVRWYRSDSDPRGYDGRDDRRRQDDYPDDLRG